MEINEKTLSIIDEIYDDLFLKDNDKEINIFLCGAKLENDKPSLRSLILEDFKKESKYYFVLPEWIFKDLLRSGNDYDLLTLEKELADYVDTILIPIEAEGSIAELGCFSSTEESVKKMIILNDEKYNENEHKNSFINIGPLRLIKSRSKNRVKYYKSLNRGESTSYDFNINDIKSLINRSIRSTSCRDHRNFINLSRLILYIILVFEVVEKDKLRNILEEWDNRRNDYRTIPKHHIKTGLNILLKRDFIKFDSNNNCYSLTSEGKEYIIIVKFPRLELTKIYEKIKSKVINLEERKLNKLDMHEEQNRFLES